MKTIWRERISQAMVSVSATRTPKDRRFNLQNNNSACASLSLVHFLASTQHEIALIFVQCVVPGNIHTPTEDIFALPPPPNGIPGGVCQIPPPHLLEFPTWFGTPWKDCIRQKCCCTTLLCERWLSPLLRGMT